MAKVAPFHSKLDSDPKVYHDDDKCSEGNNIDPGNRRPGTDNRPRCKNCKP